MRLPVSVTLIFHKKKAKRFHKGSISDIHTRLKIFTHFYFCHAARLETNNNKKRFIFLFKSKLKRSGFLDLQFFRYMTFEGNICMSSYLGNKELREKSNLNWEKVGTFKEQTKNTKSTKRIKSLLSRSTFHQCPTWKLPYLMSKWHLIENQPVR